MKKTNSVVLLLMLNSLAMAQGGPEMCKMNKNSYNDNLRAHITPIPVGKVMSPFNNNARYGEINSVNLFRAASGFYCDSPNNLPLIYASGVGFTVVGPDFEKNYPAGNLEDAIKDYRLYLKKNNYSSLQKNN